MVLDVIDTKPLQIQELDLDYFNIHLLNQDTTQMTFIMLAIFFAKRNKAYLLYMEIKACLKLMKLLVA